jgi:hypothetical protein
MADIVTLYPQDPSFSGISFKTNTPTLTTETFSGKSRRTGYGTSFYSWQVKYPTLTAVESSIITGYLSQTYGPAFSFEIILPEISHTNSLTPITTGATTNGSVSKGVKTVTLAGCGNTKTLIGGDYIKFANHSKVYQVVGTATSNSAGAMQLYFSGSLVADVPSGTVIEFDDVKFTAIVDADVQQYDIGVGGFTSLSVSMRETW